MNLQKKNTMIQLGGHLSPSNQSSRLYLVNSPTKAIPPLPSRQVIESSHRLPLKLSPTKNTTGHPHLRRKSGAYENEPSFTDLQQSKLSTKSKIAELRPLLVDRSNVNHTSSSKIRISYNDSGRNSPASSRNSSSHINKQVVISPAKQPIVVQTQPREAQLSRKLKILQARIGELHREKQQAVGKLNQENRKIYHENTSLKLKINELNKKLDRTGGLDTSIKVEKTQSIYQNNAVLEKCQVEIDHLKKQISHLQASLTDETTKNSYLTSANNDLSAQLTRITNICSSQKQQIQTLKETISKQAQELSDSKQNQRDIQANINQWKIMKEAQETQIEAIRSQMIENEQRYSQILKEYQNKIEQYQNAYNENQCLIKQLQEQLKAQESQSIIKEEVLEESQVNNKELTNECQELEFNLAQAIQQRQDLIEKLHIQNQELQEKLENELALVRQLTVADEDKASKLEQASLLLDKMTAKFQQISQRYSELTEKYESEKNKMNKTDGFQAKCKKCDQLLKTVLRLNSQLNPKRVI